MRETLKGVQDIFDERGPTDATATFNRLWSITGELMAKIETRFELGATNCLAQKPAPISRRASKPQHALNKQAPRTSTENGDHL